VARRRLEGLLLELPRAHGTGIDLERFARPSQGLLKVLALQSGLGGL
jgi:hypothetical protein